MRRHLLLLILVALLAGCGEKKADETATEESGPNRETASRLPESGPGAPLVEVDGAVLTRGAAQEEVQARFSAHLRKLGVRASALPPKTVSKLRKGMADQVVEDFIERRLILSAIQKRRIQALPEELDREIRALKDSLPKGFSFEDALKMKGMTEEQLLVTLRIKICVDKIMRAHFENDMGIADEDIVAFREQHKEAARIPEVAHIRHILLSCEPGDTEAKRAEKKAAAEEARRALLAGTAFAEVAVKYSDCESRRSGGDLGMVRRDTMDPKVAEAIFSQKRGEVGPVLETPAGYEIVEVLEHAPAADVPDETIRGMLMKEKREKKMKTLLDEFRKTSVIKDYR